MGVDNSYATANFEKQGGAEWDVGNGASQPGSLVINPGGTLDASSASHLRLPAGTGTVKALAGVGHSGAGAITLTGASVGDRVIAAFGAPTAGGALTALVVGTDIESTISVANQIQQLSASNLSADTYIFVLNPA